MFSVFTHDTKTKLTTIENAIYGKLKQFFIGSYFLKKQVYHWVEYSKKLSFVLVYDTYSKWFIEINYFKFISVPKWNRLSVINIFPRRIIFFFIQSYYVEPCNLDKKKNWHISQCHSKFNDRTRVLIVYIGQDLISVDKSFSGAKQWKMNVMTSVRFLFHLNKKKITKNCHDHYQSSLTK